jgi:hypothetical protein
VISKSAFTALAGLFLFASSASAEHTWGNYHWERSPNPLSMSLGENLTSDWSDRFDVAISDWDQSAVLNVSKRPGRVKNLKRCSPSSGEVEVCNNSYGFNGWLGVAGISVSGDHITAGYVKLNDSYFNSSVYNTTPWRQSVMCQEIGHIWGLGHNDEDFNTTTGTCMDYSNDPVPNQHPDQHDYDTLASIYSHADGGSNDGGGDSGCNPRSPKCNAGRNDVAARVLGEINMSGPRQWGRLVSEHGPVEIFELDLGDGNKIITVVRWTMERANGHHDDH